MHVALCRNTHITQTQRLKEWCSSLWLMILVLLTTAKIWQKTSKSWDTWSQKWTALTLGFESSKKITWNRVSWAGNTGRQNTFIYINWSYDYSMFWQSEGTWQGNRINLIDDAPQRTSLYYDKSNQYTRLAWCKDIITQQNTLTHFKYTKKICKWPTPRLIYSCLQISLTC